MPDAVVIGAGPNGLVAANLLADAGLSVVVFEAQDEPGGAVRSAAVTVPGFEHDLFSAFYPLAVASPVMRDLDLEPYGLVWRRAPLVVAHPTSEGRSALLSTDLDRTAESLDAFAPGDGEAWRRLYALWRRIEDPFMQAFTTPFPPMRAAARLAAALGPRATARLARLALLPVRRLSDEWFNGPGGGLLLAGNALHADLTPESPGSGAFGWTLASIGQGHGFPIPEGGAGRLTDALVRRLRARGGDVRCGHRVVRVLVRRGRAAAVRLADGTEVEGPAGVVAGTGAPQLYLELVGRDELPRRTLADLRRFQYDNATVKVDWALREPIPWSDPAVREAGTVHLAESLDLLTRITVDLELQRIPPRPFLVLGQYARADPTRAPEGADTAWAYTHVPQRTRADAAGELQGRWDRDELERFVERMEDEVERLAPGFRDRVLARHIAGPHELERANANLVGGAVNGGTAELHQQLVFRPLPGLGRAETPIRGLYLGSASAHPGGGVHGAPGANAARALLVHRRLSPGALARRRGPRRHMRSPRHGPG
jgi:phytoene dehydrogenase-like protein